MSGLGFICIEEPRKCELCGNFAECRPYGPKGEQICFECGQKNIKTTEKMMYKYLFGD
jgi:hypothetical protein